MSQVPHAPVRPATPLLGAFAFAIAIGAFLCGVTGCQREHAALPDSSGPAALGPDILARVGGSLITVAQFEAERVRHPASVPNDELLRRLIHREQLFAEAQRSGFDQSPELLAAWRALVAVRFEEAQSPSTEPGNPASVGTAELAAFHAKNSERYTTPESIRAALLQLPWSASSSKERRQQILDRAAALRVSAGGDQATSEAFAKIAREHSQHAGTRRLGGDLGWLTRSQAAQFLPAEVLTELFAAFDGGRLSPVITTPEGAYLIQIREHRPARVLPLDAVHDSVRRDFLAARAADARAKLEARLAAHHPAEVHSARLAELPQPARTEVASRPPRWPGR